MKRPGGELATRPLHFIWIADTSGSMSADGKMQALNTAIREALPHMQKEAENNPNASVLVRTITFSSGARWVSADPVPVDAFRWQDLSADGETDLGKAFSLVAEQLTMPPMEERALPPVLVLLSDGQPTDAYEKSLQELLGLPWGKKAVRIAIAIGEDADTEVLQKFIGHPELKPLQANNPEALVRYIKWVSTAVVRSASAPASQAPGASITGNVPVPLPDTAPDPQNAADVW